MRAFLAVPVEQPALGEVQGVLRHLQEHVGGVRWVRDDALHLTLHFFGQISDADAARAVDAVKPEVRNTAAFTLTLDRLGCFPMRGDPRVLWIGCVTPPAALLNLARRCAGALHDAGFAVERRAFRPHCTLGRPRERWAATDASEWRRLAAAAPAARFTAQAVVLFESQLGPGGSVHTPRQRLALSGGVRPVT